MHAPSPLALICVTLGVCAPASAANFLAVRNSGADTLRNAEAVATTEESYWAPLSLRVDAWPSLRIAGLEIADTGDFEGDDVGTSADVNPLLKFTLSVGAHGQTSLFCTVLDRLQIRARIFHD